MFRSLACTIAVLLLLLTPAPAARAQQSPPTQQGEAAPTVVIIVRHAEKAAAPADDPPLTAEGEKRARRLAEIAEAAGVNVVYATQVRRTRDTAQFAAGRLGLTVNVRNVTRATLDAHVAEMEREIRASHGKTVLVVGHSNTASRIAAALTGKTIPDLDDATEFDAIFVVILHKPGAPKLIRAKY
jgi:phosphohistidine phosphatase SixA